MRLIWSREALQDLREIRDYIAKDDPAAAQRTAERLRSVVRIWPDCPRIGRPGLKAGTRELVAGGTPFIIVYTVEAERVVVLTIRHGARDRSDER